jgi:hypothetical protein
MAGPLSGPQRSAMKPANCLLNPRVSMTRSLMIAPFPAVSPDLPPGLPAASISYLAPMRALSNGLLAAPRHGPAPNPISRPKSCGCIPRHQVASFKRAFRSVQAGSGRSTLGHDQPVPRKAASTPPRGSRQPAFRPFGLAWRAGAEQGRLRKPASGESRAERSGDSRQMHEEQSWILGRPAAFARAHHRRRGQHRRFDCP